MLEAGCGSRGTGHARQTGTHEQTPQGCRPIFRVIAGGNCCGMKSMLADLPEERKRDLIASVCARLARLSRSSRFLTIILPTEPPYGVIDQALTVRLHRCHLTITPSDL